MMSTRFAALNPLPTGAPDTTAAGLPVYRNRAARTPEQRAALLANPGFGNHYTDHMVAIRWNADQGWHDAAVVPYAPIALDPATNFIHYGQSVFEGLKAYRHANGEVVTFRPDQNAARFQRSARRLAMAELPTELFLQSLDALLAVDGDYVPADREKSLYLRPFQFSVEVGLGVRPANEYLYLLIASPAGAYFSNGVQPVTVWLTTDYVRAAPGGTGEAKCAGNYAASLLAQAEAADHGCDQVVWLDSAEHRWVEEMGGMNLYFVYGSGAGARLHTPALSGALLPGVTRESILTLAQDLGYQISEGSISTQDWHEGCADGTISEVFACGTAAVITPVGAVKSHTADWMVGDGTAGPITLQLRNALLDIQTGVAPDQHGWLRHENG